MKIANTIVWLILAATLCLTSFSANAALGSIGKVLLRIMVSDGTTLTQNLKSASDLLARFPQLKKSVVKISREFPSTDRKVIAEQFENVFIRELNKNNISLSTAMACPACVPSRFSDHVNARSVNLLSDYKDLLAKLTIHSDDIQILGDNGLPIATNAQVKAAFNKALGKWVKKTNWFPLSNVKTLSGYIDSVNKLIGRKILDAELNLEKGTLSFSISSGPFKGKIASLDLSKHYDRIVLYLGGGGGLAALGYSAAPADVQKSKNNDKNMSTILQQRLSTSERRNLADGVEREYYIYLYTEYYQSKP